MSYSYAEALPYGTSGAAAVIPANVIVTNQQAPRAGARRAAVQARRVAMIERHVAANLDDPELSARKSARCLGMSVRSLHLALETTSLTFSALVTRRRLELCRALLAEGRRIDSVADLAFAAGFNSLSSFYRAFRAYFGTNPGSLRAALENAAWDRGYMQ